MYIDDCLHGTQTLMHSNFTDPINIGSAEMVSINQLVDIVESIANIRLKRRYNLGAPKGVRGRSSDNALVKSAFGWEPPTRLRAGLEKTYAWIYEQMTKPAEEAAKAARRFAT
jgi:nucleoside-diphosphate-sugar epimerase